MTATKIQRQALDFGNSQESGHEALAGASPLAVNVVVDGTGAVHRRPGLGSPEHPGIIVSMASPIVGLHSTASGRLFAVDAPTPFSRIYEIANGNVHNLSEEAVGAPTSTEPLLSGGRRPIFAETEAMLVISAGDQPQKVLFGTPAASSRLGGKPPRGTHVAAYDARIFSNQLLPESENMVRFSDPAVGQSIAGHESWQFDGFFLTEARPDPVVALHENSSELFAFGTTSVQIYAATGDPDKRFAVSNTREFGCSAPYSVVKFDQNFAFVDGHRRIVLTDGRDYQFISAPIQQTLDDIADWSDVFAYRVTQGPVDALCWCSPTDGRTFAYQASSKSWSIWMGWDDATSNFSPWLVRCAIRVPETGEMLAGYDASTPYQEIGRVARLSNGYFSDGGILGKIVARVDTGFVDRGTSGRKLCRALRLSWRGRATTDTEVFVQWRDDNGPWEHQRQVEIGQYSECILRSLGVYRRRQWRITFHSQSELVLARAEEEFEVLAV